MHMSVYPILTLRNSLKMIKVDRNMSGFLWIVINIILTSVLLVVLLYELTWNVRCWKDI